MFAQIDEMLVQHGATLIAMPTSHPRHTITETPQAVRESLLREIREGTIEIDIAAADEVKYLGLPDIDER